MHANVGAWIAAASRVAYVIMWMLTLMLMYNVDLNVHLGTKGLSGTNWKDSIRGSIPSVVNVNFVRKCNKNE